MDRPVVISTKAEPKEKRLHWVVNLILRLVKEKPMGTVGGIIIVLMLFIGIFANFLAPYGMNEIDMNLRLTPSSPQHIFGTDALGRDILSRVIFGARISMIVGLSAAFIDMALAGLIGICSGYFGGKIDLVVQRFVDGFMCFPPIFLYMTIMAVVGAGMAQVIVVLGFVAGIRSSRVVRSAVISIKENVYVEAARATGTSPLGIILRHILPNVIAPLIIIFTLAVGVTIMAEATLSFLGFGIPPPTPSWGGMLSGQARQYMFKAPWLVIWPGAALALVIYGINMLGDAVRDIFDPRLKGGLGRYSGMKKKIIKTLNSTNIKN
jgi:peptide/nickel transport system permease protein